MRHNLFAQAIRLCKTLFRHKKCDYRFALCGIGPACHGRFGNGLVGDKGAFQLHCAKAMAGDLEHVVRPAKEPEVSVLIDHRIVAWVVHSGELVPVHLLVFFIITPEGKEHPRPRPAHHDVSLCTRLNRFAIFVNYRCVDSRHREGRGTRLHWDRLNARAHAEHYPTGFCLPPGVNYWASVLAYRLKVPHPDLRVYRLAHGAEQPERREIKRVWYCVTILHVHAERCRSGVQNGGSVFFHNSPIPVGLRIIGSTFVHYFCHAEHQWRVDNVAVACYPANIRGAKKDVLFIEIKDPLCGRIQMGKIAASSMHDSLGLASSAGRVEDVEGMDAVDRLGWAVGFVSFH